VIKGSWFTFAKRGGKKSLRNPRGEGHPNSVTNLGTKERKAGDAREKGRGRFTEMTLAGDEEASSAS